MTTFKERLQREIFSEKGLELLKNYSWSGKNELDKMCNTSLRQFRGTPGGNLKPQDGQEIPAFKKGNLWKWGRPKMG